MPADEPLPNHQARSAAKRYRWTVEFEADNDADADEQVKEALGAFHSYSRDDLEEVDAAQVDCR